MILRYNHLSRFPTTFQAMTGLRLAEFDELLQDVLPLFGAAETKRLTRATRRRAVGGGHPFELAPRDQVLLTVVWLRRYPIHEVLGFLFAVSDSTVGRYIQRVLPLLEATGRATMRLPDPGRKQRRQLDELLQETPALAVVIDSFEQRVQRPRTRSEADPYYSGKKKQHTLKSQIAVDELTGEIVDVAESVPGPTADIVLLEQSGLLTRLPAGVGALGDLAYMGIAKLHPKGQGATPRKKPGSSHVLRWPWLSIPPSPNGASSLNTASYAYGTIKHSRKRIAIIANSIPHGSSPWRVWSIARSAIGTLTPANPWRGVGAV